jgi:hypothetical protein
MNTSSFLVSTTAKVHEYLDDPSRIRLRLLSLRFAGDNAEHEVTFASGAWRCDCHTFGSRAVCSHVETCARLFAAHLPADAPDPLFTA